MLQATKLQKGDLFSVKLSGSVDETVDFSALVGSPEGSRMEVSAKEITRINSQGIKAWLKYFQGVAAKGIQLRFIECSTATVEQFNMISNFHCGGAVESIYVPYICRHCSKELLGLYRVSDLKKIAMKVPELTCPHCQGEAVFDDVSQEYFAFMSRK